MPSPSLNDADLVHASLAGDRGAFGRIVARYQSLVCSLAYSATGNLNRSEDLAQETFLAAWKQLPELREPAKLRAWLCGIARNLISNAQRRAGREPAHLAEPFDAAHEAAAAEPSPPEQAVTREEEALLWRALEKIPDNYREPLVLFYREHKSVEAVARELDLTEDAVKQRLSRGRALLHEQVLALVEGTLERTNPGRMFTVGVLAALPAAGAALATATGLAGAKGAAGAKSAGWLTPLGTILTAQVLWFVSSLAFVAGAGGFAGWQMADPKQSDAERRWAAWFWRLLTIGMVACVFPAAAMENFVRTHPAYSGAFTLWLGFFYVATGVPMVLWAIANHRRIRQSGPAVGAAPSGPDRTLRRWVAATTVGMTALFAVGLLGARWTDQRVRPDEVWPLILAHPQARLQIDETPNVGRWIAIFATENGRGRLYRGPLNEPTHRLLRQSGRPFTTSVRGRDHDVLGWPARRLPLVTILAIGAGLAFLVRARRPAAPAPSAAVA
ncbi:MAG: sigma-70 family RNA polymerase sigma factor [Verrucomicrobia bacterium]|nr:sigma-70 family RNA polymerase sigma factor [Verrucomicrobiota bacterium]